MLLHLVAAPLRAQDDAKAPPAKSEDKAIPAPPDGNSSVRIDNTGIHVGGEEPVDINLPNIGWGTGLAGAVLPIISVLAVFGMPVAIVGLFVFLRHRRNRMLHETLRAMVEKGVPIPPELLSGKGAALAASNGARPGYQDLRNGLILIALGAGLFFMVGKIGLIPGFIGMAMIIAWLIGSKTRNHPTPP
jgi:hypothetical protein